MYVCFMCDIESHEQRYMSQLSADIGEICSLEEVEGGHEAGEGAAAGPESAKLRLAAAASSVSLLPQQLNCQTQKGTELASPAWTYALIL